MFYVGFDPGNSGAIVAINGDTGAVDTIALNKPKRDLIRWCQKYDSGDRVVNRCNVEKVQAFSGQGVKSCFTFGASFGTCETLSAIFNVRTDLLLPQQWQKRFDLYGGRPKGMGKNEWTRIKKAKHKEAAQKLYEANGLSGLKSITLRTVDALLIACCGLEDDGRLTNSLR